MDNLDEPLKKNLDFIAGEIARGFNSLESNNLTIEIGSCPGDIREYVIERVREGTNVQVVGCDNFSGNDNRYRVDFQGLLDYMKINFLKSV